jgi:hypothetical protein
MTTDEQNMILKDAVLGLIEVLRMMEQGNWYLGWVSAQVSVPILTGKKELKEMKARELANRRKGRSRSRSRRGSSA